MRLLHDIEISQVIRFFDVSCKLTLKSSRQIEPDAFLYDLSDKAGNRYGLLCRDYMQDDASIESRILNQEQGLTVLKWLEIADDKNDYRVFIEWLDSFQYVFALFKYKKT